MGQTCDSELPHLMRDSWVKRAVYLRRLILLICGVGLEHQNRISTVVVNVWSKGSMTVGGEVPESVYHWLWLSTVKHVQTPFYNFYTRVS